MWSSHNLTSLTNQSSYEFPVGYRKAKCVVVTESDGKANTRLEYQLRWILCGAWWGVIHKECNLKSSCCKVK